MTFRPFALSVFSFVFGTLPVAAVGGREIPEIGTHHPILFVHKDVNPQNLMVVYTKVDADGRFQTDPTDPDRPMLDFYWLMDGKRYKPVHRLIKKEIGKRLACELGSGDRATHFVVNVNDLKEVHSDIDAPKMDIYSRGPGGVEAEMNLGPSDGNMRIRLSAIYTEGRAFPPAVNAVTLKGEEIVDGKPTGRKVTRRYAAKK